MMTSTDLPCSEGLAVRLRGRLVLLAQARWVSEVSTCSKRVMGGS